MEGKQLLMVLYIGAGLLLVILSVPLLLEKVRPNPFYGFRVAKTFQSTEIWYAANKYAARRLLWAGIATVIAAIGLYLLPQLSVDLYALAYLAVVTLVLGISVIQSLRYLCAL